MPDVGPALGWLWKSSRGLPTGHPCAITGDMLKSRWAWGAAADGRETRPLWGHLLQRRGLKTQGKLEFCFLAAWACPSCRDGGPHAGGFENRAISTASGGWSLRSRRRRGGSSRGPSPRRAGAVGSVSAHGLPLCVSVSNQRLYKDTRHIALGPP